MYFEVVKSDLYNFDATNGICYTELYLISAGVLEGCSETLFS